MTVQASWYDDPDPYAGYVTGDGGAPDEYIDDVDDDENRPALG